MLAAQGDASIIVQFIPVLPATIAAAAGAIASIAALVQSLKSNMKADGIAATTIAIHQVTNGRLSHVTDELTKARQEVASLKELVRTIVEVKEKHERHIEKLAASTAIPAESVRVSPTEENPEPEEEHSG